MLSNKIVADRPLAGNENRAHVHKGGRYQEMTPRSADGPIAGGAIIDPNCVPGREQPPGILNANSIPMTRDSHAGGHHAGTQNLAVKPGEKSRVAYADEITRRLHSPDRSVKYR